MPRVAHSVLKHRLVLNVQAAAEGFGADKLVTEVLARYKGA